MTLSPTSLANGQLGIGYSQTLTATGGTTPRTFSITAGSLPAGLALAASTGIISGTPTVSTGSGTSITATVTDAYGCSTSRTYNLKICPTIALSPATLPNGGLNTDYSQTITASGGAAPYTYSLSSGSLPEGLNFDDDTAEISGRPVTLDSGTFTIVATDANGCQGTRSYTLTVACPAVTITPELPNFTVGTAYSETLEASPQSGLLAQYFSGKNFDSLVLTRQETSIDNSWGSGSPDPLVPTDNFSARWAGFLIPPTTGTYSVQVTADDGVRLWINGTLAINKWFDQSATTYTVSKSFTAGVAVTIKMEYYENGGSAVAKLKWSGPSVTLGAASPWRDYTWAVVSGSLPAGLSLNASTGVISGTPTSATSATFTVRATDGNSCVGTKVYTLAPDCTELTMGPASLAGGTVGTAYSQTATASGGASPLTWEVASGTLPAGLTLNTSTGMISGTPTTVATSV
ncbi:MAG: putative Ig domain-containing protein, partial [Prosthecobacter sp.]|nr:putative Ig domain-containing protein [Prosthecobacter sp.]